MAATDHARWIVNLCWDDLPGEVRRQATLCLTDIIATAAGAKLLGLPAEGIDAALGMAEYYAPMSPMLRCTDNPSVVKDAAGPGGWAAAMALAMARRNMVGLPSIFSSEPLGREQAETLGGEWLILRQYFKPYPTCRWAQPAVEGLKLLQAEHGFEAVDVERIDIETFACAADLMHFPPEHTDAAQYSLPWAVAAQLVDGALGVAQMHPDRLADPEVLAAGRRVYTSLAPDLEARFPEEALARTAVTLTDGRRLTSPTMAARGDWADPLSPEELAQKAERLMVGGLGEERATRLLDMLATLSERPAGDLLEELR
ncbi:MAG: hypothetical protein GF393_01430 [Armatimonadia bacterium]|nr:hypothetical protein [Armatimonadia bacterium]